MSSIILTDTQLSHIAAIHQISGIIAGEALGKDRILGAARLAQGHPNMAAANALILKALQEYAAESVTETLNCYRDEDLLANVKPSTESLHVMGKEIAPGIFEVDPTRDFLAEWHATLNKSLGSLT